MKIRLLLILLSLGAATVPLAWGVPSGAAGSGNGSAGFGSPFAQWVRQHRPDSVDCRIGSCYGPLVDSASVEPEFSFIETFRGHVVGYEEALRRGTPLLAAELEIAQQFPSDVSIPNSVTVIRHDRYGHACAVLDLYSKTLAREFGRKGPANQGDTIGVELVTVGHNGSTGYQRDSIDLAVVSPVYLDSSINC